MTEPVAFMAVRPHPDDESSATGGMLARFHAEGMRTAVVCCTGGEEGEIVDPHIIYEEAFPRLRWIREHELFAACRILGVSEVRLLGYRDSGMAGTPANAHPHAFWNVDVERAAAKVAGYIRELRPRVVVTENEHGSYGHPDHIMCHRVTVRAWDLCGDPDADVDGEPWQPARLYAMVPVTEGWDDVVALMKAEGLDTSEMERMIERRRQNVKPTDWSLVNAMVHVGDYAHIQREALLVHRTQIRPTSFFMGIPTHIRRRAFATTYLHRLAPVAVPGDKDEDIFPAD
jgi:LmbE family N-acetylglucosaminyl deacetylase